ncbi:MAG: prealbumin-like fold domain-containing protein, partial [Lachnospiraceae bacterium]|nr:prealbumin-like fold domain-containing protein [Lachnospiraceae bacterium]
AGSNVDEQEESIGSDEEESLEESAGDGANESEESIAVILMEEEPETVSEEEADADSETETMLLSVAEDMCQLNLIVLAGDEITALEGAVFTIERHLTDADSGESWWEYLEGDGTIFTDQDGNETRAYTSDGDGAISVGSLESGTYRVTQVRTRAGYSMMAEAFLVTLPRVVTDSGNNLTGTGEVYYYEVTYTIVNTAALQLPYTGADSGTVRLTGFAGMILVAAAGLMLCGWDRHSRPEFE